VGSNPAVPTKKPQVKGQISEVGELALILLTVI